VEGATYLRVCSPWAPSWSPPFWILIGCIKWDQGRVTCHSGLEFYGKYISEVSFTICVLLWELRVCGITLGRLKIPISVWNNKENETQMHTNPYRLSSMVRNNLYFIQNVENLRYFLLISSSPAIATEAVPHPRLLRFWHSLPLFFPAQRRKCWINMLN